MRGCYKIEGWEGGGNVSRISVDVGIVGPVETVLVRILHRWNVF